MPDIYLFGMILKTNSFLLKESFPNADSYGEISKRFVLPGGETGTCATVLSNLGCMVIMDGNHMGINTYPLIKSFYENKSVDISPLTFDKDYDGLEDYVIIDKDTRTPFGMFCSFFSESTKRWNTPSEDDVKLCKVAAIDPFFQEASQTAGKLCVKNSIKYVTIDCNPESFLHRNAEIAVISGEYFHNNNITENKETLFEKFTAESDGLIIFTSGSKPLFYGRKSTGLKTFLPYKVETISTLGAGDTFKAACTYALLKNMSDDETVEFASACAAVACTKFPLPLNPPTLEEVYTLINTKR